jgi:GTP 3',8-cyclase
MSPEGAAWEEASGLRDTYGRLHENLRVSVTDRCNIRCFFCMPETVEFVPRGQILSFEEIKRFVRLALPLGIRKVRLTGGEPLVRRGLPKLIRLLSTLPGVEDVGLTTNGILLTEQAEALYNAGLSRINIHLDTLDRERFIQVARRDELDRVLAGIEAAQCLGYAPIKINAVVVKGLTEPDVVPLARFGREKGLVIRFIEFMPLDAQGLWDRDRVSFADDMIELLSREICPLVPVPDPDPRTPATEYLYSDGIGKVGVISTISRPFCPSCNRVRLTADGKLRYCLFALEETDILALLRGGASDEEIAAVVRATVRRKWEGHEINTARFLAPPRPMYAIGG